MEFFSSENVAALISIAFGVAFSVFIIKKISNKKDIDNSKGTGRTDQNRKLK